MEIKNSNEENAGTWKAIALILGLISLGLGYMVWDTKNEVTQSQNNYQMKLDETVAQRMKLDSISAQLDIKITEVNQLGGKVDDLLLIKEQLEKDKAALKSNNISAGALQSKIRNYESILTQKDALIAKLKAENQELLSSNTDLGTQVQTLNANNTELQGQKASLETERTGLNEKVNIYTAENKKLSEKVSMAAALRATNVKVYGITSGGREKDKTAYRAKKVDKIKIAFNLPANNLTTQEAKEVIIRLLGPDGAIISDEATGSGIFTYNGQQTVFTTKQNVNYTNSNQLAEIIYSRNQKYASGKHNIELFSEGYKIGEGSFEVK